MKIKKIISINYNDINNTTQGLDTLHDMNYLVIISIQNYILVRDQNCLKEFDNSLKNIQMKDKSIAFI